MSYTINEVDRYVRHLHDTGARHRKGFRLNELSAHKIADHVDGEMAELFDAATHRERIDEAGDVLACVLHLFYALGLPLGDVTNAAMLKLRERFQN